VVGECLYRKMVSIHYTPNHAKMRIVRNRHRE